jgi:hypothetical protein
LSRDAGVWDVTLIVLPVKFEGEDIKIFDDDDDDDNNNERICC